MGGEKASIELKSGTYSIKIVAVETAAEEEK